MANSWNKNRKAKAPGSNEDNINASQAGATPNPAHAKIHSFSRTIAKDHGEKAAVLLQYLAHHVSQSKHVYGFDQILQGAGIEAIKLPPKTPNLNAYAERWIRSIRNECLEQLILFGERSLAYVIREYLAHHQRERNHQGMDNVIPFPDEWLKSKTGPITKSERLGGLLQFYYREAA